MNRLDFQPTHLLTRRLGRLRDHSQTDVYIVSFPKAGRTWLRVMIGKALVDTYELPEDLLLNTFVLTTRARILATRFTHDGSSIVESRGPHHLLGSKRKYRNKKVILLVRDIRDTLVSCYFQATKRVRKYEGSVSDFLRDERYGARKIVSFYKGWYDNRHVPNEFAFVRYEDMHIDARAVLRTTLSFIGAASVQDDVLYDAVDYAEFGHMKRMERRNQWTRRAMRPGTESDEDSFKVRRGVVGGYMRYLNRDDVEYVNGVIQEFGSPFGLD
jgi:hypothetical protein